MTHSDHTLDNKGFSGMVMLSKQPLYGQILVELEENWKDCRIFFGRDIGFKLSQILAKDVWKTFKQKFFTIYIALKKIWRKLKSIASLFFYVSIFLWRDLVICSKAVKSRASKTFNTQKELINEAFILAALIFAGQMFPDFVQIFKN